MMLGQHVLWTSARYPLLHVLSQSQLSSNLADRMGQDNADNALPAAMGLLQERASLKQSQLSAFLSGQVPLEQLLGPGSKKLELMGQIQDFMTDTRQV